MNQYYDQLTSGGIHPQINHNCFERNYMCEPSTNPCGEVYLPVENHLFFTGDTSKQPLLLASLRIEESILSLWYIPTADMFYYIETAYTDTGIAHWKSRINCVGTKSRSGRIHWSSTPISIRPEIQTNLHDAMARSMHQRYTNIVPWVDMLMEYFDWDSLEKGYGHT